MTKRILFFLIFVIVLVSLNWFQQLLAQDLSSLSDDQKEKLRALLPEKGKIDPEQRFYQSPPIFDEEGDKPILPYVDSGKANTVSEQTVIDSGLVDFDQLQPFGMNLFAGPRDPGSSIEIASADDYILGPGDNLIIYLWGGVEREYNLTLDREGKLFIPKAGELIGWGLTLKEFRQRLRQSLSNIYSDFNLTVSLGKIRSLRVFVTGEVQRPGVYTVNSLTSLLDVIYLAGGPNHRGSMRSIKLRRNGKEKTVIDLYDFLLSGDNSSDIRLQNSDIIFVPVTGPRVAIRGEIRRPAIYEINSGQTAHELLELAGNATARAHLKRVELERISSSGQWQVIDLDLRSSDEQEGSHVILADGDRLSVYSIFGLKKGRVGIFGQVKHAGYYERTDSTRISDLVRRAGLQPYDVYFKRADLFRRHANWRTELVPINLTRAMAGEVEHDLILNDLDSLHIRAIAEVEWDKHVYIEGEVKKPGRYRLYDNMTMTDLIFLAGSLGREASRHQAEIARLDIAGKVSLHYVSLQNESFRPLIRLEENDHIYIRKIPQWQLNPTVVITGEVQYPGEYMLSDEKETLYQIIKRAGGFTSTAFPEGIVVDRSSIEENLERTNIKHLIERSQPLIRDSLGRFVQNNIAEYEAGSLSRIVLDMDRIIATEGREGDIVLKPDDQIHIPPIPSGVSVLGAVGANGTIRYEPNKKAKDYIKLAGNFVRRADKHETKLIRANGEIVSGKKALNTRAELGDMIFVPTRIEKEGNWFRTFTGAMSATTGLLTSIYIISKL